MTDRSHILIVEDDPLVVEVMVASLESDYHVSSVNTVAAALAFLRMSRVDVALIDKILPDGRGTEVAWLAGNIGAAVIEMSGYPQGWVTSNTQRICICSSHLESRHFFRQ